MVSHLLRKTVMRIPMFCEEYVEYASLDGFQLELHPHLKPVVYELGETVVAKRTRGADLYYLDKGTVAAFGEMDAARALFQVTDVGAIFGEHATLGRAAELSYKAITRCEVRDECMAYRRGATLPESTQRADRSHTRRQCTGLVG